MSGVEQALREKPEITYTIDISKMVDEAEIALVKLGGIYVRGRRLVHMVRDRGSPGWIKLPEGMPVIEALAPEHLHELLGRAATWLSVKVKAKKKPKGKGKAKKDAAADEDSEVVIKQVRPFPDIAKHLLARGQWKFDQLEGISDVPVFRHDGTICDKRGYDPTTRIFFDPGRTSFPAISARPSRADAVAALAELAEPFDEFPFVAPSDKSAAIAFILSVVGRNAIDGCVPMFASRAPTPGSGKGFLVDIVSLIATGRSAPLMSNTHDDDEMRKRLLALALEAPSMAVIDNVAGALGSPTLAMALTAGSITDRVLGQSESKSASLRMVWAVTGNNIQFKGDLGRRVVPIDIDPRVENPEDRTFRRTPDELRAHVLAHRPSLVVAALTILRAYVVAEKPKHGKSPKGSFEAWDVLVRGAIMWAGGVDPLAGVDRIRAEDDEDRAVIRALLQTWRNELGGMTVTLAEVIKRAGTPDKDSAASPLYDALGAFCKGGKPDARTLGNRFKSLAGRPVAGMQLVRKGIDRNGVALWKVLAIDPQQAAAGSEGFRGVDFPDRESDFIPNTHHSYPPSGNHTPQAPSDPAPDLFTAQVSREDAWSAYQDEDEAELH